MKEGQSKIYYVVAENHRTAASSPHLEVFRKKGIEVLLLSDRVDDWLMNHLSEFDGSSNGSIALDLCFGYSLACSCENGSRAAPTTPSRLASPSTASPWCSRCRR